MANGDFAGGDGTEQNPYLIEDTWDLNEVRNNLNACYKLINNIDLDIAPFNEGEGWSPISGFNGVFDGNFLSIINLYINKDIKRIGLFSNTDDPDVIIKNLKIIDASVKGGEGTGALVGRVANGGLIKNCRILGNSKIEGTVSIGGLVGNLNYNSKIQNCFSVADVEASERNAGSLVGYLGRDSYIINSYAKGSVYAGNRAGGLVGFSEINNPKIENCYSTGEVKGKSNTGGLVGYSSGTTITSSFWDIDTSGLIVSDGGIGLDTKQMKKQQTFIEVEWNKQKLENNTIIWSLKDGKYPELWFETEPNKSFIFFDEKYKKYDEEKKEWKTVTSSFPTLKQFQEEGMENLSILDRKVQPLKSSPISMTSEKVDEGKLFKSKIDLKKTIHLRKIEIKLRSD